MDNIYLQMELGAKRYNVLNLNQYDRNIPIEIELINYNYVNGDIAKIEWIINNKVALIQTDIKITDNILTLKLRREVTLNAGHGFFNVVIENTNDDSRIATFKSELTIEGNSINEDTTSTQLAETTIEQLQKEETNANNVLNNLTSAIEEGKLDDFAKKTDLDNYTTTQNLEKNYVKQSNITQIQKDIINLVYPIGIYVDFNANVNPNKIYTWQKWTQDVSGTVLVSCTNDTNDGDFGTLGITGGSKTQKANLSNTAFAQIAIAGGSKRIQAKQVATDNWNSTLSLVGSSANSTVQLTSNGVNVAGTTNDFNNCMPYKTSCRWYRIA